MRLKSLRIIELIYIKINKIYYWPLVILMLISCEHENDKRRFQTNAATDSLYFPSEFMDSISNERKSKYLAAFGEKKLFTDFSEKTVYRFLILKTFYKPIVIRVENYDNRFDLYWKETDGEAGYFPGKLILNKHKKMTKAQWDKFEALLLKYKFWDAAFEIDDQGLDGEAWIVEGSASDKYHIIIRWEPCKNPLYDSGTYLIGLTDISHPAICGL